jgi:hypothetical protein
MRIAALIATVMLTAAPAEANFCVGVNLHFTSNRTPTAALVRTLEQEASQIWQPYGVVLDFESSGACTDPAGSFEVVFERRVEPARSRSGALVLGTTRLQLFLDRAPIVVDYDAIDQTVHSLTDERLVAVAGHHGVGSVEVGRALGRVLAHEIGHVLLAAPNHQPHGLMRPHYVPADLVAMERFSFTLSPGEVSRLRHRERVLANHLDHLDECEP